MTESSWSLHPQLAADTVPVGDLALARVLLATDANYPWLILVPRKPGLTELIDLSENEQVQLLGEVANAARALKHITACDKLKAIGFDPIHGSADDADKYFRAEVKKWGEMVDALGLAIN